METSRHTRRAVRFATFELDLSSGELRKHGTKIRLQEQPFQILAMLLENPGEIVTRDELRQKLWPSDTFVDFDVGLNSALVRLRATLGDSAERPRFIETLPRRGYRFIAPVETEGLGASGMVADAASRPDEQARPTGKWILALNIFTGSAILFAIAFAANLGGFRYRVLSVFSRSSIHSIAVLPLKNLSGDPSQEYFADGMTDALITDLAKFQSLRVISRSSTMRYRDSHKPLAEIARELNVDAIVEGSIVRSGSQVRITAQLIHAASDRHLWAESYERDISNIVPLQSEVARNIATQVQVRLTQEGDRPGKEQLPNPQAYDAYLKGRYFWSKFTLDGVRKSLEYYQEAIDKDPPYAPPYAGLAFSYINLVNLGILPPREGCAKAETQLEYALEKDDSLAEAHAWLGYVKMHYDWDLAGAEKEFQRAIELNPGDAQIHHVYGHYLLAMGRVTEAWTESRRTLELDPSGIRSNSHQGWHYFHVRDYDQAIRELQRALTMEPSDGYSRRYLANAYEQKGLYSQAIAALQATPVPPIPVMRAALGYAYAVAGNQSEARKIASELEKDGKREYVSALDIALIYLGMGDRNRALNWLERAFQERSWFLIYVKVDPRFDLLRSDSRFKNLLRRIGLPP